MSVETALKELLERTIRQAGLAILEVAREGFETRDKGGNDPVTTADLRADRLLRETLTEVPGTGWLSEETRDDPARLQAARVWIVDPMDGTREFVNRIPEFSVSVALVEAGEPILGAVYNPSRDELFTAVRGEGATLNGRPIQADAHHPGRPVLYASRSELRRGEWEAFKPYADVRPCGSIAYKLALVAAGRGDGTFSLGPKNEWDIAAGVLLVQEAGGQVHEPGGQPFRFNRPDTLVPGIVATSAASAIEIEGFITRQAKEK